MRKRLDIHPGESGHNLLAHARHQPSKDLKIVVDYLRDLARRTYRCEFAFSDYIEDDSDICLEAGVDYLALEGAEAATIGAPPILEDDFGLPTLIGLCRAVDHLKRKDPTGRVSLIAGGGFSNPGHYLGAIALGADAVYLGTMGLCPPPNPGVLKAVPFGPPTQVALYRGTAANRYNYKKGRRITL